MKFPHQSPTFPRRMASGHQPRPQTMPARHMKLAWRPLTAAVSLVSLISLSACQNAAPEVSVPREVVALPAQADGGVQFLTLPGEVQSRFVTPMSFRVAGQVVERRVHLGDAVHKGDVVARLDPADANHNVASAQADLASARAHLEVAEKQLQRDTQQARANLISALQLEQTQDAYAAAKAQLRDAEARAAIMGNQSNYTLLIAEHDGVISAEQANTGEVLAAGQPVFSLAWSGAIDVTTEVSESQVAKVRVGASAVVRLTAMPSNPLKGRVREVSPAADPQSRTYRVKVTLETQAPDLRLGMSGEVMINTAQDKTTAPTLQTPSTIIPATALFHQGNRAAVWIVRPSDAKLELRPVTVGAYGERSVTIQAGLAVGEEIVVQGVHTLSAGEKVKAVAPLHAEDFAS